MLVLSRKLNEKIQLGDNITVTVLRVQGNTIRLGIDAPRDVRILRGELEPLDHHRKTKDQVFTAISENPAAADSEASPSREAETGSPSAAGSQDHRADAGGSQPRATGSGMRAELEQAFSGRPLASFVAAHKPTARRLSGAAEGRIA